MREIAEAIKARREELGWSQAELARRAGVSRAHIVLIESGERAPSMKTLRRLFSVLGLLLQVKKEEAGEEATARKEELR